MKFNGIYVNINRQPPSGASEMDIIGDTCRDGNGDGYTGDHNSHPHPRKAETLSTSPYPPPYPAGNENPAPSPSPLGNGDPRRTHVELNVSKETLTKRNDRVFNYNDQSCGFQYCLDHLPATSFQLPAISYQLPATSFQLPATRCGSAKGFAKGLGARQHQPSTCAIHLRHLPFAEQLASSQEAKKVDPTPLFPLTNFKFKFF
ncbi:hypothetical protein LXL04_033385 [Taraxacum kok-saghyz]